MGSPFMNMELHKECQPHKGPYLFYNAQLPAQVLG